MNNIGEIRDDEYEIDGLPYCKKCNTQRFYKSADGKYILRCMCKCQEEERNKADEIEYQEQLFNNLHKFWIADKKHDKAYFDTTTIIDDKTFVDAYNRSKGYCEHYNEILEKGYGLYFSGNVGSGKTHLLYCIANELVRKGQKVLITNFTTIMQKITDSFGRGECEYLNRVLSVPFLLIDDIGTENITDFKQEQIFNIINDRYNKKLPTIFTSNLKISDLKNCGFEKRILDRIFEMSSAVFNLENKSYRIKAKKENELPF